jgi:C-terminal processing protease CtpA/Prc
VFSVATVDYDYSKAYVGGGELSVSSAGGTFGSNRQGISTSHASVSAIRAVADYPDDNSADELRYRDPKAGVKEEYIEIIAPAGKLGVVIDTPNDAPPVVHAVKDSSPISNEIRVGDRLVAVDDEDVRTWSAIEVSKLLGRKRAKSYRKLGIIRSTFVG